MQPATVGTGLGRGQLMALVGTAAGALAVFVAPLVLGPLGVACGIAAIVRGERRGRWVIAVALVGLGLGLLVNLLPADSL